MQEMRVQSLGQEDLLEWEMATHSSLLAWEIPWTEEPRGLPSMGLQKKLNRTWQLSNNSKIHLDDKVLCNTVPMKMFMSAAK